LGKATVTLELALPVELAAVTMKLSGAGKEAGAVYFPVESIVPKVELPPCTPFTLQVAVVAAPVVRTAVNCWVAPRPTVAELGLTENVGGGGGGVDPPPPQDTKPRTTKQLKTRVA